jgi:hypothetical protein
MKINKDHLYHGAALTQVAEHRTFKAINEMSPGGVRSRCAFRINADIYLYFKYTAIKPRGPAREFIFNFNADSLAELQALQSPPQKIFICLICVKASHICCINYDTFLALIKQRKLRKGADEQSYQIIVTLPAGKQFRVYMNFPDRRNLKIGPDTKVPRDDFPHIIFE